MTNPTTVDRAAPIIVEKEVTVNAPIARVWALHSAPADYPAWQHSITASTADGPLEPGRSFTWTSYGFTVTSSIWEVEVPHRTLWGGTEGGITGIHEWHFDSVDDGTRVRTVESWSGPTVEASVDEMRTALDGSLDAWLDNLKVAAERDAD